MHGFWKMMFGNGEQLNRENEFIEVSIDSAPHIVEAWNESVDFDKGGQFKQNSDGTWQRRASEQHRK